MSLEETPSALAFSRSMSILKVGLSSRPFGTHERDRRLLAREREQLVARLHELVMADTAAILAARSRSPTPCRARGSAAD